VVGEEILRPGNAYQPEPLIIGEFLCRTFPIRFHEKNILVDKNENVAFGLFRALVISGAQVISVVGVVDADIFVIAATVFSTFRR